jgi:two-component system NtrC family sensor kinase
VSTETSTVLIIDDRPANRYTLAHALTRAGFKVVEAATGREALELSKQSPTVIVLDVKLPDIVGYEVCRRIKANPQTRHIPVLQLSAAFLNNESKLYALESGADAYLMQPADPVVLVATVKSLVRLHHAESKAQLAARQWQATFDSLTEGVAIVDDAGVIQRNNRAMTELLGKSYSEIETHHFRDVLQVCFGRSLPFEEREFPVEVQSGSRFFRVGMDSTASSHGVSAGSILIVAERTQQKLAEEALLNSERLAATGRIAHTIAHEINNPLEAITNLLYLMQGSLQQPEVAREYLESAVSELARVSRISKQILSFNRESFSPTQVDINELLEDVLALNNRAVLDKGLQIEKIWRSGLFVHGFPSQLRQVFSNLVRNAIEASFPHGRVRIKISGTSLGTSAELAGVRVTIADSGVGIPPENLKRIFEAFFTTKELKGSGIGLWLSSSIVDEHGGRLRVRSSVGAAASGTCISVVLPSCPSR